MMPEPHSDAKLLGEWCVGGGAESQPQPQATHPGSKKATGKLWSGHHDSGHFKRLNSEETSAEKKWLTEGRVEVAVIVAVDVVNGGEVVVGSTEVGSFDARTTRALSFWFKNSFVTGRQSALATFVF